MSEQGHPGRALEPRDLFALDVVNDVQISPDGTSVAYVVTHGDPDANRYTSAIVVAAADGSSATRTVVAPDSRNSSPRWSPDGQQLAFISNRSGTAHLYLQGISDDEPRQLTTLERGAADPVWSRDGSRIAFTSSTGNGIPDETRAQEDGFIRHITRLRYRFNDQGYIDDRFPHIWSLDVASGEARQHTWGDSEDSSPRWSPDGTQLAFVSNREGEENTSFRSQLYVIATDASDASGTPGEDADAAIKVSGDLESVAAPAWSPDGTLVACVGHLPNTRAGSNGNVFVIDPQQPGSARNLTAAFDRSIGTGSFSDTWSPGGNVPLFWPANADGPYFTTSNKGAVQIFHVPADGTGKVTLVQGGDRTIAYVSATADGSRLAYAAATMTDPSEVFSSAADGSDERQISDVNGEFLSGVAISQPQHFTFTSHEGGYEVDAWLVRPRNYDAAQQYPLVQIIHGGPHSIFGHTFFFDMQLWASQGYNVLFINPRASQGYGEAFATANLGDWGGGDWQEQEEALNLAIAMGGVDPERLAVTGLSYGGFMTNWIIGQTTRYRAAISENGISNLISFFTVSDIGWYWLEKEMEKPVWENLDWYTQHSPLAYVPQMQTPLLLLQAEADYRCPIEQGEQLYTALRARDVPTKMVRFPGDAHTLLSVGQPRNRLVRREESLRWLKTYL